MSGLFIENQARKSFNINKKEKAKRNLDTLN